MEEVRELETERTTSLATSLLFADLRGDRLGVVLGGGGRHRGRRRTGAWRGRTAGCRPGDVGEGEEGEELLGGPDPAPGHPLAEELVGSDLSGLNHKGTGDHCIRTSTIRSSWGRGSWRSRATSGGSGGGTSWLAGAGVLGEGRAGSAHCPHRSLGGGRAPPGAGAWRHLLAVRLSIASSSAVTRSGGWITIRSPLPAGWPLGNGARPGPPYVCQKALFRPFVGRKVNEDGVFSGSPEPHLERGFRIRRGRPARGLAAAYWVSPEPHLERGWKHSKNGCCSGRTAAASVLRIPAPDAGIRRGVNAAEAIFSSESRTSIGRATSPSGTRYQRRPTSALEQLPGGLAGQSVGRRRASRAPYPRSACPDAVRRASSVRRAATARSVRRGARHRRPPWGPFGDLDVSGELPVAPGRLAEIKLDDVRNRDHPDAGVRGHQRQPVGLAALPRGRAAPQSARPAAGNSRDHGSVPFGCKPVAPRTSYTMSARSPSPWFPGHACRLTASRARESRARRRPWPRRGSRRSPWTGLLRPACSSMPSLEALQRIDEDDVGSGSGKGVPTPLLVSLSGGATRG